MQNINEASEAQDPSAILEEKMTERKSTQIYKEQKAGQNKYTQKA